ncbi:hypothetical protein ACHAWF_006351 [Thalassiosira exigua]
MGSERKIQALTGVTTVDDNDIICGRGGLALKHPGNMAYRKIVGLNKELYATCLKTEKLRISKSIVAAIREIKGRFLEREDGKIPTSLDEKDAEGNPVTWKDIGDKRAVEKTSQALREGQPKLLKKLALQKETSADMQVPGAGHAGIAPQSQMMPQFGHNQPPQQFPNNFGGMPAFGQQPPLPTPGVSSVQNALEAEQQRQSFALSSLTEGQTFSTFPRNSFVENGINGTNSIGYHDSRQDSWGPENPAPLGGNLGEERSNLKASQDSWGIDPTPLPYNAGGEQSGNAFSNDDHQLLMNCLGFDGGISIPTSAGGTNPGRDNKRPSVKFQLAPQRPSTSAATLSSAFSDMSILSSDALSLDSGMDAAHRDAEFDMLGEFDPGEMSMSMGTFDSPILEASEGPKPRRSILRKSNKWSTNNFPAASSNDHADPGMLFTSTLDRKPGGVNAGTDVSGVLEERRKSVVAFEVDVNRRRSSRMSMTSALTEVSAMFKREVGSTLSIQSADIRQLMEEIGDESDEEENST